MRLHPATKLAVYAVGTLIAIAAVLFAVSLFAALIDRDLPRGQLATLVKWWLYLAVPVVFLASIIFTTRFGALVGTSLKPQKHNELAAIAFLLATGTIMGIAFRSMQTRWPQLQGYGQPIGLVWAWFTLCAMGQIAPRNQPDKQD